MFTRKNQFLKIFFPILCVLAVAMAGPAAGKSLYLIANHHTKQFDAWNIEAPGSVPPVTYQATYNLTHAGDPGDVAVWVDPATDPPEAILFITSEFDYGVELVDAKTMTSLGWVLGAHGLAGITMDNTNGILYTVDRDTDDLYAYDWDPVAKTLTPIPGMNPFNLPNCLGAFGISLDDISGILYVADTRGQRVRGYDVNTWTEVKTIALSHIPMGIEVDKQRGFVYTVSMNQRVVYCAANPWGSSFGSTLLSKYDLATDMETTIDMGNGGADVAVDEATGFVYVTEGCESDRLTVWDTETTPFTLVHATGSLGSPAAVAIANRNVSYNPLNLAKNDAVVGYGIYVGQTFTYEITCDNNDNPFDVTGVTIVDDLPVELDFVSETVDGVPGTGIYDAPTHTVTWDIGTIPAGQPGPLVELVVLVNQNATPNTTIYNYCTIESDETPPTTVIGDDPDNPDPEQPPGTDILPSIPVALDIKPRSCPNPLNPFNRGYFEFPESYDNDQSSSAKVSPDGPLYRKAVLPAAVLGTVDFDVADIDPATIMLDSVPAIRWNYEDVSTPMGQDAEECACNTDGPDGLTDLTLKFDKAAIVAAVGEVSTGDTVVLTLTGELSDGTPIVGSDCMIIVGHRYDDEDSFANTTGKNNIIPEVFALDQNRPNPFNPTTEINFSLPKTCQVKLEVYNIMGQKVTTLIDSRYDAGFHSCIWDASGSASGVYFYQIKAGEFTDTKKMILLK